MNWKALLAVTTLVVLIYSPTWGPAVSQSLRPAAASPTTQSAPAKPQKIHLDAAPAHSVAVRN